MVLNRSLSMLKGMRSKRDLFTVEDSSNSSGSFVSAAAVNKKITVGSNAKSSLHSTSGRVSFNLDVTTAHENTYDLEELKAFRLWYEKEDFDEFREDVSSAAKIYNGINKDHVYRIVVDRMYGFCCEIANNRNFKDDADKMVTVLRENDQLLREALPLVGMERYIVRRIWKERSSNRKQIVEAVLEVQRLYPKNINKRNMMIQARCEQLTRPQRLFASSLARILG